MGHKTLATLRVQDAVTKSLANLKSNDLKIIAVNCGVTTSGRKADVNSRLNQHFNNIITHASHGQVFHPMRAIPQSILSFDIGYRNLAHVKLDRNNSIIEWTRTDLQLEAFHPSASVPAMSNYIKKCIMPILDEGVEAIALEQQRYRQNGGPSVFEHTIRVNSIEAMLWYALYETVGDRPITMDPISRQAVDRMWRSEWEQVYPPPELIDSGQRNRYKKAACVKLVDHWLDDEQVVRLSRPELKDAFRMEKKQDDMADCLLQAMTWYRWRQATLDYIQECYDHHNN